MIAPSLSARKITWSIWNAISHLDYTYKFQDKYSTSNHYYIHAYFNRQFKIFRLRQNQEQPYDKLILLLI